MRIGIDASRANEEQKTGVGWYAWHIIEHLKKIIPENISVVLYSRESLKGDLAKLPKNWEEKVLDWPPKKFWTQIRLSLEMIFNPPDVLFVPAHVFPIFHPKKTVMTVHDIASKKFPEAYDFFERWYTVWSAKFAVKKLWRVIVPTCFVKKELIENFNLSSEFSEKITVVHHGLSEIFLKKTDEEKINEVSQKYSLPESYLLSVGRLEEKKNTGRIVKAFEILKKNNAYKNLKLVLVGNPGFGYEKIKKTIEESFCEKDIIRLGWVEYNDLPVLLKKAKVFVFPSFYEGFGLPVLESLATGTPAVVSNIESLNEVAGDSVTKADELNEKSIADAIQKFLEDKNFSEIKIKKGIERAKNFTWEKSAKETLKILL